MKTTIFLLSASVIGNAFSAVLPPQTSGKSVEIAARSEPLPEGIVQSNLEKRWDAACVSVHSNFRLLVFCSFSESSVAWLHAWLELD